MSFMFLPRKFTNDPKQETRKSIQSFVKYIEICEELALGKENFPLSRRIELDKKAC